MIIKTDFVTNSSSAIYMIYIPQDFHITTTKMVHAFNEQKPHYSEEYWKPYNTPTQIKNAFNEVLDKLKNGKMVYSWDEIVPTTFWNAILNVLDEEGLIMQKVESGASGDNCMAPIKIDSIEKIIKLDMLYGGKK